MQILKKISFSLIIRYALALGILVYLIRSDSFSFLTELYRLSFVTVLGAVAIKLLVYVSVSWRWWFILQKASVPIKYWDVFFLNATGLLTSYVLPSAVSADVGRFYYMRGLKIPLEKVSLSIFMDRLFGLVSLLLMLVVGLLLNPEVWTKLDFLIRVDRIYVLSAVLIVIIVGLLLAARFKHRLKKLHFLSAFADWKLWAVATVVGILSQGLYVLCICWIALRESLTQVTFINTLIVFPLSALSMIVPTTPGALGVGQVIYKFLYDFMSSSVGSDGVLIFTVLQLSDLPFLGIGFYFLLKKKRL